MTDEPSSSRRVVWAAGLFVASGAAVATAHGLYEVAAAASVPPIVCWLYPLITDGLALVAYAATSRLDAGGRRYAAAIVVMAAGLSGLAQAVYLAGGLAQASAPVGLRFGVGAWPAIAAALTAHLVHLVADSASERSTAGATAGGEQPYSPSNRPYDGTVHAVQPTDAHHHVERPNRSASDSRTGKRSARSPRDRAHDAATRHQGRNGTLPTVSDLVELAQVSRGTAGTVLKDLREGRSPLHIVPAQNEPRTQQ